jgi:haloacetate dehalogenase
VFEGLQRTRIPTADAEIAVVHGGSGPPLLLLHGYPQTHTMWHQVAPDLAEHFSIVVPDLRGYGDSSKPPGGPDHAGYSKRAMAADQVSVMAALGFDRFAVAGHDRGGRMAHRLALDHPDVVTRAAVLDIAPTLTMYRRTDKAFATAYYHWFFLIQPYDLPERLICHDPDYYLERKLAGWGSAGLSVFAGEALAEYRRCFRDPATIHATCEDYRASAGVDLEHDEADLDRKVECPLLVLWGDKGVVGRTYDVLATWRERAKTVSGRSLPCGHYLAEEAPDQTGAELLRFFSD